MIQVSLSAAALSSNHLALRLTSYQSPPTLVTCFSWSSFLLQFVSFFGKHYAHSIDVERDGMTGLHVPGLLLLLTAKLHGVLSLLLTNNLALCTVGKEALVYAVAWICVSARLCH